jgi:hypothetical protein
MRLRSRRDFFFQAGGGLSGIALAYLLQRDGLLAAENPYAPKPPHHTPRATRVISLFMSGGVSHVDTFDPKPALKRYAGQPLSGKGEVVVRQGYPGPLMPSPFEFHPHGQSGIEVSELFPEVAKRVDDLAVIRSAYSSSNDHVQAHYELSSGVVRMGYPSVGSWLAYGLGTENESLPAFLVIYDAHGGPPGGPANWGSGFLPATYQGTVLRPSNDPIFDLRPPPDLPIERQRARLNLLDKLNELHSERNPGGTELAARTASYELAFRMQAVAPEAIAIDREPEATRKLYGLDNPVTAPFGKQCLMARRLVERGVRFVQLFHGGLGSLGVDTWDAHIDVKESHTRHAAEVDRPIAALLQDLKTTGLLDSTLLLWQTEFGRMPISQSGIGRDHNPGAMTVWMAGARIRGGQVIGASDEFGYKAEQQPVSVHDLHATILDLLGLDHKRLTFRHHGRDMRLTDVYGSLIPQVSTVS